MLPLPAARYDGFRTLGGPAVRARLPAGVRRSLQRRIVASVLLGLGIVLVGIGYLVVLAVGQATDSALHERLALARAKEHEVEQEIRDALEFLTLAALERPASTLTGDPAALRVWLQQLARTGPFSAVAVIDLRRGVVAASSSALPRWLQSSRSTASYLSGRGPAVFEVEDVPPNVGLAAPLTNERNGALWLVAELHRSRFARHLLPEHAGPGIYEAEILTGQGRVVVSTFSHGQAMSAHAALIADLAARRQAGIVLHRSAGKSADHYVAYVPLATVPRWGVITEHPVDVVAALPLRLLRWMMGIGAAVLAMGALVAWLDVQRVVAPLRALTRAAHRIGRGDLATPVAVQSDDEVGVLAQTVEEMRDCLQRSLEEIRQGETRARALYATSTQILASGDRDRILENIVSQARVLLGREVAALCLLEPGTQRPVIVAAAGTEEALTRGRPGLRPSVQGTRGNSACCGLLAPEYLAAHIFAPLTVGGDTLGCLCVGGRQPLEASDEDRALLAGLANLGALAVENARLQAELAGAAAVRERERIARELHDSLAQALSSLHAMATLARIRAEKAGAEEVNQVLQEMEEVSGSAYEEIRQSIFGLRTAATDGPGLIPTLAEYLQEFGTRRGLQARLLVEDGITPRVPAEAEIQLVRIIGEALYNVWRHARARQVEVHVGVEGTMTRVTVEDDGVGFNPAQGPPSGRHHYGLAIMSERAESAGGSLEILSAPGQGTKVVVRLPLVR